MKKIITMVGTSLFENYLSDNTSDREFVNYLEDLNDKPAKEYDNEETRVKKIRNKIIGWFERKKDKENISAEIKSLVKLKDNLNSYLEIHLLSSDTVLSYLAGNLIQDFITKLGFDGNLIKSHLVKDLQVWDKNNFNNGLVNLLNKIYQIVNDYWDDVIINITGGYKAVIPYLTIFAQVHQRPIYYIFEKTDALISISPIPIDISWGIFDKHMNILYKLEKEGIAELNNIPVEDLSSILSFLEKADNYFALNPLGITLWEKYKKKYDLFYLSHFVERDLNKARDNSIIINSLRELKRRLLSNPEDPDLNHKLVNIDLKHFKCFKHKENSLQVRIFYKTSERRTIYNSKEIDIYVGSIFIGYETHNSDSEYVKAFENQIDQILDLNSYKIFKIEKQT
ncbi:MAG: hypothetical protein NUV92_03245 [Ignavibacteria bacterium]|jgi:putative CRISPR-associated protein (TIGR02619 family)|nr:hypothetical protein [Ignavibacteria bacterium]MDH7528808.1 hypothetical protein [Ignavibacteria bacterium]